MTILLAFVVLYTVGAVIAVVASRRRAALVLLLAAAVLPLPLALPDVWHFARFVLAMGCAVMLVRVIDLLADPMPPSAGRRLWHLVAVFDTRRVGHRHPGLDLRDLARVVGFGALALATLAAAAWAGRPGAGAVLLARWLLGTVMLTAAFEACTAGLRVAYALGGVTLPPLHHAPWLSRSIAEFWGRRWNQVVGAWLGHHCYRPLARRRRPTLGVWAAFGASALLHVYIVGASLGPAWAVPAGAFFLLQPVLLAAERTLRVPAWPTPLRRVWTVAALVITGPLFVEPVLRMLEV